MRTFLRAQKRRNCLRCLCCIVPGSMLWLRQVASVLHQRRVFLASALIDLTGLLQAALGRCGRRAKRFSRWATPFARLACFPVKVLSLLLLILASDRVQCPNQDCICRTAKESRTGRWHCSPR